MFHHIHDMSEMHLWVVVLDKDMLHILISLTSPRYSLTDFSNQGLMRVSAVVIVEYVLLPSQLSDHIWPPVLLEDIVWPSIYSPEDHLSNLDPADLFFPGFLSQAIFLGEVHLINHSFHLNISTIQQSQFLLSYQYTGH